MIINRYNYQEYFLLYTDNELKSAERLAVESFIQQNPDLEEELIMLQQSVFKPDEQVVFENKKLLFQFDNGGNVINSDNYVEFAISYSDNELNSTERIELENFISNNPQYQQEFDLILGIKLSADDSISFPNKEVLYRHEKAIRPLIFLWRSMAAAAVLLLFAGLYWLNEKPASKHLPAIAKEAQPAKKLSISLAEGQQTNKNVITKKENHPKDVPASPTNQSGSDIVILEKASKANKGKNNVWKSKSSGTTTAEDHLTQQKRDESQSDIVLNLHDDKVPNPVHIDNSKIGKANAEADNIAFIEASIEKNNKRIKEQPIVNINTLNNDNYLIAKTVANTEAEDDGSLLTDKKSPLRGFLRKASRFIDKNTSSRTSKKSGLLIGNIEIAFQ